MAGEQLLIADFMAIFSGAVHNYGQHRYDFSNNGSGKSEGRSSTVKNKLLTIEQYRAHLEGKVGLGIIPINEESKCLFAVVDVDLYDKDLSMYIRAIEKHNFPIVPFKSKSGGLHLYTFFKSPVSAKSAIDLMREMSSLLSIDLLIKQELNKVVEIFPKQYKIEKGNVGSWINLPYFNAKNTRQCAIKDGEELSLEDALVYIKEKRTTLGDAQSFVKEVPHGDGPPCLQSIHLLDPLDNKSGGRNVYLFSFGVYQKKKDENFFEQNLFQINQAMSHPVKTEELEATVLSSLRKRDYTYKCYEHPCVTFCKRQLCKTRQYGIGKEGGYFSELEYGQMTQIRTSQPYYEWEVKMQGTEDFTKLRFRSEDEIIKQDVFLRLCFRELKTLPVKLKQSEWFKIVNQSLAEMQVVQVDSEDDMSVYSLFRALFTDFLLNRAMAQTKDQLFNKRVYFDPAERAYMFRAKDLIEFLFVSKNFRYLTPTEVYGILKDYGAFSKRIYTESRKQLRVYMVPSRSLNELQSEAHVEEFVAQFETETDKDF